MHFQRNLNKTFYLPNHNNIGKAIQMQKNLHLRFIVYAKAFDELEHLKNEDIFELLGKQLLFGKNGRVKLYLE